MEVTLKSNFNLKEISTKTGVKAFKLAFALSKSAGCEPSWGLNIPINDTSIIDQIKAFHAIGGEVIVSTGRAKDRKLETNCVPSLVLKNAYKQVLDAVESRHLDISVDESIPLDNMNAALAKLQKERPQTTISFSFNYNGQDYGITSQLIVEVLENSVRHGVNVDIVNTIVENFVKSDSSSLSDEIIWLSTNTMNQLKIIWPAKSTVDLYTLLGVTPFIGNNFDEKVFSLATAKQIVGWAKDKTIGQLSFWSIGRDNGHCPGREFSYNCSGIEQEEYEFTKIFSGNSNQVLSTPPKSTTIGLTTIEATTLVSIKPTVKTTEPHITDSSATPIISETKSTLRDVSTTLKTISFHTETITQASTITKSSTVKPGKVDCSISGSQYPHEKNCNQYYWCYDGVSHLNTCPAGTIFDIRINRCNFLKDVHRADCNL
jgi:hypothetical protein